jgi:hypothetical protein
MVVAFEPKLEIDKETHDLLSDVHEYAHGAA